jgi:hypothetical protein
MAIRSFLYCGIIVSLVNAAACFHARANTFIMILRFPEAIIIAADSKTGFTNSAETYAVCKIHSHDNFVWLNAGVTDEINGPFDINRIVISSIEGGGTLDEVVSRFNADALREIVQTLTRLKTSNPTAYEEIGRPPDVATVGIIKNADIAISSFILSDKGTPDSLHVELHTIGTCKGCGNWAMFGMHGAAETEMTRDPNLWKDLGLMGTLNRLLKVQEAATPKYVGPPLSILRIDKSGALTWLQKGLCD